MATHCFVDGYRAVIDRQETPKLSFEGGSDTDCMYSTANERELTTLVRLHISDEKRRRRIAADNAKAQAQSGEQGESRH